MVLILSSYTDMYPIFPSFDHWAFPHGKLPSVWKLDIPRAAEHPTPRQSTLNEAILSRDIRCRITNHIEGTECAHLVPRSESLWFQQNLMALYGKQPRPGCQPVDNPRNAILLRSNIHTSFNYKRFAFVPKLAECSTGSLAYVTHIFCSPEPHELTALYHNVALQPLTGVAPEYLFARFAWTIFQFVSTFLQAGIPRRLVLHNSSTDSIDLNDAAKSSVKTLTGEECRMLPLRSKFRNRVTTFDEAFQSRIHFAMKFSDLSITAKKKIWKTFLEKVPPTKKEITDNDVTNLSCKNINGPTGKIISTW
jgi:HNH endonuclease